jgi:hypothetical protein
MRPTQRLWHVAGRDATDPSCARLPALPWSASMDTFAFIVRYAFVAALLIEAAIVGRAFFGMLREKARAATAPAGESAAPQE